jgi:tRNA threonylcarbamoyl adenosine modification protein (Sua5/YciO/YrdC/YwlC family)
VASRRAHILEVNPEHHVPHRIRQAVSRMGNDDLVVYPTDTLYGLGGRLSSRPALDRIYTLRGLDRHKPLSVVCASVSEAARYAVIPDECFRIMRRLLPGPYTFVLPATREVPKMGDKRRRSVGVRIPAHPVAVALLEAMGEPLLSASAILDDDPPEERDISDPRRLAERYGGEVSVVIDAGILRGGASSVIEWTDQGPEILRRGAGDLSLLE